MKRLKYIFCERKNTALLAAGVAVVLVAMFASTAFGDVVDDSLPPDAPQAVIASVRQTIGSGIEQDSVVRLTRAMLQNKFDAQQIQLAHALMIEAQNSGMPVEPLINKAFEGMAKGVDPSLIVGAIERGQSRNSEAYRHAAQLSGNKLQTTNLGRELSAAMAAGFLNEDAERITRMIRQRAKSMSSDQAYSLALECFKTARDISRLGVSSQATTNMLAGALGKGFTHQEIHAMRSSFMAQARQSQPQDLARRYSATIQEGKGFQEGPGGDAGSSSSGGNSGGGSVGPGGGGQSGGSGAGGSGPGGGGKQ